MSEGLGRFKPYPEYKDSGVEWLGKIPKHWQIRRLKYVATIIMGQSPPSESYNLNGEGSPFLQGNADFGLEHPTPKICCTAPLKLANEGDNLLSVRAPVGALNTADRIYGIGRGLCAVRPLPRFLDKCFTKLGLQTLSQILSCFSTGSTYDSVSTQDVADLCIVVPPLREQRSIAEVLYRITSKINALIAKKERLIELLEEKRAAAINHAVTKSLDQSTPMKDSDIEWLERIPAHWEIKRLQDIAESLQTGPFGSQLHADEYIEGGRPVVNPANMQDGVIVPDNACTVDRKTIDRLQRHALEIGDIVVARRGQLGRCALTTDGEAGWLCGTGSLRVRLKTDIADPEFVLHAISTTGIRDWLELYSVGSTMQNLNTRIIGRIPLAMPPAPEQRTISKFLNFELSKQASSVERIETGVKTLIELRAALVSAAVTGKIDVRDQH